MLTTGFSCYLLPFYIQLFRILSFISSAVSSDWISLTIDCKFLDLLLFFFVTFGDCDRACCRLGFSLFWRGQCQDAVSEIS